MTAATGRTGFDGSGASDLGLAPINKMSTKLEDWHYFSTFIEKALPSFSSPFFPEEALDGLLHRNTSSTTHLLLDLSGT